MNTRIIDTADAVVRRYKTRNPEEIISQRAIKLKDIRCCRDLLGYYTVMLNCEYIGINPNCTDSVDVSHTCFRAVHTLRRVFLSENLQLCVFINTKIQLPVLTLWAVVFPDDRKAQLVHIKILCDFIVRYDNCNMMYFR